MTGVSLQRLVNSADTKKEVCKSDLRVGDYVFVVTCNSLYTIMVEGERAYRVSGGWFDKKGLSPVTMSIAGCTWGGSSIKVNIVAACGLRLEFGNRLITSPIQKIIVVRRQNLS
jgi:hypothetical protein